jgi:hypothetical protein
MGTDESTTDHHVVRRLADVEVTPSSHVDLCLHVAAFLLIDHVRMLDPEGDLGSVIDRFPFVTQYLDGVVTFLPPGLTWNEAHAFWADAIEDWERDHRAALPMCRLRAALGLGRGPVTAMFLAALAEEDSRFGHIWAHLNGGVAHRPTFETVAAILGRLAGAADSRHELLQAVELGLLTVRDDAGPRSEWIVSTAREVWDVARGGWPSSIRHEPVASLPALDELVLDPTTAARCRRTADRWGELDLVVVRGSAGSDPARRTAAWYAPMSPMVRRGSGSAPWPQRSVPFRWSRSSSRPARSPPYRARPRSPDRSRWSPARRAVSTAAGMSAR